VLRFRAARALAALALAACPLGPAAVSAALSIPQRDVLTRYLEALRQERYPAAFALLTDAERRYFGTAANFASGFAADRLRIRSFRILASTTDPAHGTLAIVSERIAFFDPAHQAQGSATAKVAYGLIPGPHGPRVKDPFHPWRALAPAGLTASASGVSVDVRKISFFTGRVEVVLTFENHGDATVTLLPYGRSLLHDDAGHAYQPIATKLPGLTDRTLYTGLRLAGSAEYTGVMAFATPDRYVPKSLTFTFAPALLDGGDAPFELDVPTYLLPN
jgi:hypothetical protein